MDALVSNYEDLFRQINPLLPNAPKYIGIEGVGKVNEIRDSIFTELDKF